MMHRNNQRHCVGCYYYRSLDGSSHGAKACHYLLETGNTRGCSPEKCVRKISKEEFEMRKLTETDKRNIVAARQAGTKVIKLAKQYGVDKSTIYNIIKMWKEHGESAFSGAADNNIDAEEIACELHGTPPVSVDCDTDIEAYNQSWEDYRRATEKEPVTAATDTSSEQNIIPDNSTDIVTENPENVKTSEGFPQQTHTYSRAAIDAVYDCICRKQHEIASIEENMTMLYAEIDKLNEQINTLDDMQQYTEAELDRLWIDYSAICGGGVYEK